MKYLTLVRGLPGSGKTSFVWRCIGDMLQQVFQVSTDDYFMVSKLRNPATCDCYERHIDDDYGEGQFSPQPCCYEEVYAYKEIMEKNPQAIGENHEKCRLAVKGTMMDAYFHEIWVHNTFSCRWELEPYLQLAKQYDFRVAVVDHFDGGLTDEELHDRGTHDVPIHVIQGMRAKWEHDWKNGNPIKPWERTVAKHSIPGIAKTMVTGTDPVHEAEEAEKEGKS